MHSGNDVKYKLSKEFGDVKVTDFKVMGKALLHVGEILSHTQAYI